MNIIDLNSNSLLDYVLYSRICLLERLLGMDMYSVLFADKPQNEISTNNCEVRKPSAIPVCPKECGSSFPFEKISYGNSNSSFRPLKYRSRVMMNMYWKTKMSKTSFRYNKSLKSHDRFAFVSSHALVSTDVSEESTPYNKTDEVETTEIVKESSSKYDVSEQPATLLFSQLPTKLKKNSSCQDYSKIKKGTSRHKPKNGTSASFSNTQIAKTKSLNTKSGFTSDKCKKSNLTKKNGRIKKKKPVVKSMSSLPGSISENNVFGVHNSFATCSETPPHELLLSLHHSPTRIRCSDATNLSAGDSVSISVLNREDQVLSEKAGSSNFVVHEKQSQPLCKMKNHQRKTRRRAHNRDDITRCSDISEVRPGLFSDSTNNITTTPYSQSNTNSVATEISDSSSYRFVHDFSTHSGSQALWKTCSDVSLPSIRDKSKPLMQSLSPLPSTQQSLQNVDQVIPRNNANTNAKNLLSSSAIVGQVDNIKGSQSTAAPLKDVNRFAEPPSMPKYTGALHKPGLSESRSVAQQLPGYSTSQMQQHSMLTVDQHGSFKYPLQSKDLVGKQSLFLGRPSAIASSATGTKWTEDPSAYAVLRRSTQPNTTLSISQAKIKNSGKRVSVQPVKLQRGLNAKDIDHCDICGLGLWKIQPHSPMFFNLSLILLTFAETTRNHYGTITKMVDSTLTIYGLMELIKQEQDVASSTIRIYKEKSRSPSAILPFDSTLEECGFQGSSEWDHPTALTLYYDYDCDYFDCPILVSDHYFINRKRQAAKVN